MNTSTSNRQASKATAPANAPNAPASSYLLRRLRLVTIESFRIKTPVKIGTHGVYPYLTTVTDRDTDMVLGLVLETTIPTSTTWIRCLDRSIALKSLRPADPSDPSTLWTACGIPERLEPRDEFGAADGLFEARCGQLGIELDYPAHESERTLLNCLQWAIEDERGLQYRDLERRSIQLLNEVVHVRLLPDGTCPLERWQESEGGSR